MSRFEGPIMEGGCAHWIRGDDVLQLSPRQEIGRRPTLVIEPSVRAQRGPHDGKLRPAVGFVEIPGTFANAIEVVNKVLGDLGALEECGP